MKSDNIMAFYDAAVKGDRPGALRIRESFTDEERAWLDNFMREGKNDPPLTREEEISLVGATVQGTDLGARVAGLDDATFLLVMNEVLAKKP